jgi:tRNA(Ile)-lysidine synthase
VTRSGERDKGRAELGLSGAAARPVSAAEFSHAMDKLGPFESRARLAVAVSGGRDSMALALLAHDWAKRRGGDILALTVDHGLRRAAKAEALKTGAWLRARGIAHRVLVWRGDKPKANLQALARAARYRLLGECCREAGILHLLLAHQQDDQAETLLLRLARGSGLDGLAAMAPRVTGADLQILRPLLALPRARLAATLATREQDWIEDPSNLDPKHARTRLRALMPALAREGLTTQRLAATATRLGRARLALEDALQTLLAHAVSLDPAGYAILDAAPLVAEPAELALRALAALLQTVGGADYPPRLLRLERLHREILESGLPAARTLGGCRILRLMKGSPDKLLICREPAALAGPQNLRPGESLHWDGRFLVSLAGRPPGARGALHLAALGAPDPAPLRADRAASDRAQLPIPAAARRTLPALYDLDGLLLVPHLCYGRGGREPDSVDRCRMEFRPARPLALGAAASRDR